MTRLPLFLLVAAPLIFAPPALANPRRLTRKESEAMALLAFKTAFSANHLAKFEIDDQGPDRQFPGFEAFRGLSNANPDGGSTVGFIDVDQRTGDTWYDVSCFRITNPVLRRAQRRLRRRLGLEERIYRKIRRPGPYCN